MLVRFDGLRGGSGPLTFGQRNTLNWVGNEEDEFSAVVSWTLLPPAGATMAGIAAAFGTVLARHEALRTTYSTTGPGGEPEQRVAAEGTLVIEEHPLAAEAAARTDTELAGELETGLRAQGIDFTRDLPLRVAVATEAGVPRVGVVIYSHMAVDFNSMTLVGAQLIALLSGAELAGEPAHQPLDQAEVEHSTRGQRQADAALRYWETHLRSAPQSLYPMPAPAVPVKGWLSAFLTSPAAGRALGHIAVRTGASRQVALLAAMCAVLGRRTGISRCVFASVSGNRFRLRLRDYVGSLAQDGLLALDVAAPSFDELVRRANRATLATNTNSMFDSARLWRLIDRIGHERGTAFTRDFSLNNLSSHLAEDPLPVSDPAEIAALGGTLRESTLQWVDSQHFPIILMCNPMQLTPELMIALTGDTRYVPRSDLAMLLHGLERLLVAAAARNVDLAELSAISGVIPVVRGPEWVCVDSCWVDLGAVHRLLATALPGATVHVSARSAVVAQVAGTALSPTEIHARCMALLREPGWHTAMAPGHYVVRAAAPARPADTTAWDALPVLAAGSGRE